MSVYYFRIWGWFMAGFFIGTGIAIEDKFLGLLGIICLSICLGWEVYVYNWKSVQAREGK